MRISIEINTENAAFADNENQEIARILQDLANKINHSYPISENEIQSLRDYNGNKIGFFQCHKID